MDAWIASLAGLLGAGVTTLARETAQRLMSLWKTVVNFFTRVKTGWSLAYGRVRRWSAAQVRHALAVMNRLRWIVAVYVPARLQALSDSIVAWTREQIHRAEAGLAAGLRRLSDWAAARLGELVGLLDRAIDWARREIASVATLARATAARVADLLASPERLAAWLLGPLTGLLWRTALDNAPRIGELAWRYRQQIIIRALATLEEVLVRII